jgi:hypothetical protein
MQQQQSPLFLPAAPQFAQPPAGYYDASAPPQHPPPQHLPPPPHLQPPNMFEVADARMEKLRLLAARFEINPEWVKRLRSLESFGIVMICDDSGSMNTAVDTPARSSNAAAGGGAAADPFGRVRTRWVEMCETASVVCELGTALNDGGVDVFFLNRPPALGVTSALQLQHAFAQQPPQGYTPLTSRFKYVLEQKREVLRERNLLVLIATDGEPTDEAGTKDVQAFLQALKARPSTCFVQIMACTDVEADIAWLTKLDEESKGLDVIDDFLSERASILKAQGPNFKFSYGDYIVKALLGPSDEYFDTLDEVKGGCCSVA